MPQEKLRPSFTFDKERMEQLKVIVPEAFADGKINWETLHEALGDYLEDENPQAEHFGLFWPGKREARRLASIPSTGTLVPCVGEGINESSTNNIFVEGDNLEVLKLFQKSYAGRVKIIYIDPPYNTGGDFVYQDDFKEPIDRYLEKTGEIDEENNILTTNPRSNGRFHSNWLTMMYPRMILARTLLKEDGVIFISIDENELSNLWKICDEIFGEENFIANIVWKHTQQSKNDEPYFSRHFNTILVYRKSDSIKEFSFPRTEVDNKNYSNPDSDPKGDWRSGDVRSPNYRRTLCYEIETPSGNKISPPQNGWRWSKQEVIKKIESGEIIFNGDETKITRKIYLNNQKGRTPENVWAGEEFGTTRIANAEIKALFNDLTVFDTPKPTALIKRICQLFSTEKDYLVLDFFAGSCTTADSILSINNEDGGQRTFIMIQLPETTTEGSIARTAGYTNVAQIGKDRIRRVIKKLGKQNDKSIGFKVFKLDRSNFKAWQDYHGEDVKQLEMLFSGAETPLVEGWTSESLLTEVLLIQGFPLDSKIIQQTEFKKNKVQLIESDASAHRLFVCLDDRIHEETETALKVSSGDIFICLDSAMTDQAKMRLANICTLATI
ncbi:site-specific DNA-methyltransferase [Chloroflexota bacterium]